MKRAAISGDSAETTGHLLVLWAVEIACHPLIDTLTHEELSRIHRKTAIRDLLDADPLTPEESAELFQEMGQEIAQFGPRLVAAFELIGQLVIAHRAEVTS
jgi:hypothetical protein